ncbi:MAG: YaaA family protein [Pseudomonadota bacterium]|nr:YaaA family protein [Pseudomonadota bacterium]
MIIISPSKNLNLKNEELLLRETSPIFTFESKLIIKKIRLLGINELKSLMKISDTLAELNHKRFQEINKKNNTLKAAAFLFSGDTFNGLSIRSMNNETLTYSQRKLKILSGLYGILRPFDLIEPYRLEMGVKIRELLGMDLYGFWSEKITSHINEELKMNKKKYLFNLASNEYFSSLSLNKLDCEIVSFDFKKKKNNNLSSIGMMIKKLRGAMARFILENKIEDIQKLKDFKEYGFKFHSFGDSANQFIFASE